MKYECKMYAFIALSAIAFWCILVSKLWRRKAVIPILPQTFFHIARGFFKTRGEIKKYSEQESMGDNIAVVLANNYWWKIHFLWGEGIDLLIDHFRAVRISYKVYTPLNKDDFFKIVMASNTKELFIFGHGGRHGLQLNKLERLRYCELSNAPKKRFIAQFHCNDGGGNSLKDYIGEDGFVDNDIRHIMQNRRDIKRIIKQRYDLKKEQKRGDCYGSR